MREQTITFFTKAHFWFFFFQNHAWKLGVRLIHECGLYTSFYGNITYEEKNMKEKVKKRLKEKSERSLRASKKSEY